MSPRNVLVILACVGMLFMAGCLPSPIAPVWGWVYSDYNAAGKVTPNLLGQKVGEGYCESIVSVVARGDCSIETIAKQAKITRVTHVDYKVENILSVYTKVTVFVYGN